MSDLNEQEQFLDEEFLNNLGDFIETIDGMCPIIDEKLVDFLKFQFGKELGFDKNVDINEYHYRTGVVEVIKYLQYNLDVQQNKKED